MINVKKKDTNNRETV